MATNHVNEEMLKEKINEYVIEKGWHGFFGLLATISPVKVVQEDLKKNNDVNEETLPDDTKIPSVLVGQEVNGASIYAAEHIVAVQKDLIEHVDFQTTQADEPKTETLEPYQNIRPNPWETATVVLPGEVNFK